jgi:hypothetical protein
MMLFAFAMTNFSIAKNLVKSDETIIFEAITINKSIFNTSIYSDPVVVITEPKDGDIIHIPFLEVTGYAIDPDGLDYVQYKWEWASGSYTNDSVLDVGTTYNFRFPIYNLPEGWHRVTVTFCDTTNNCSSDNVTVIYIENESPTKPGRPYGPDRGIVDEEYTFSTHSTDPEEDTIRYGWDWDGDNVVDEWSDYNASGQTIYTSHNWSFTGTYSIKVMAEDEKGGLSGFSIPLAIVIYDNSPPNKPSKPTGAEVGIPGISYSYSSSTIDLNADHVYYMFNWDDGTEMEWIGPYNSGDTVSVSHIWSSRGTFQLKVKAIDDPNRDGDISDGDESVWSEPLPITMSKTKTKVLFKNLYDRFPLFQKLLTNLIS